MNALQVLEAEIASVSTSGKLSQLEEQAARGRAQAAQCQAAADAAQASAAWRMLHSTQQRRARHKAALALYQQRQCAKQQLHAAEQAATAQALQQHGRFERLQAQPRVQARMQARSQSDAERQHQRAAAAEKAASDLETRLARIRSLVCASTLHAPIETLATCLITSACACAQQQL